MALDCVQELARLVRIQGLHLGAVGSWRLNQFGHIARDQAPTHRLLQRSS